MFELMPFDRRHNNSISRYDSFKELENFSRGFWDMDHPWSFGDNQQLHQFSTDIRDDGDKYVIEADLPGFNKEDINVDIQGNRLTISAQRSTQSEDKDAKGNYIRCERSYGSYSRSFDISGINTEAVTAEYKDGVLTLDLPKPTEEKPDVRRLTIQ